MALKFKVDRVCFRGGVEGANDGGKVKQKKERKRRKSGASAVTVECLRSTTVL